MTMQLNDLSEDIHLASSPVGLIAVPSRPGIYRNGLKRVFDLSAVLLSSVIVVPLTALIAFFIALDGQSPFYWNERVGRGGRTFRMLKLRTMVANADELLTDYLARNPDAQNEWATTQKLKFDPRVTLMGRFLRKSSLDELPQLWNVLAGDMSLVGPRPMMPSQRPMYPGLSYYGLRPGLTGFWQISDRNACTFAKRAEFDGEYDEALSFVTDIKVLLRTFGAVARGTGY